MLACDLVIQARAAQQLNCEEISRLERLVFDDGPPSAEGLETILLIDRYIGAGDLNWSNLLARAASAMQPGIAGVPMMAQSEAA